MVTVVSTGSAAVQIVSESDGELSLSAREADSGKFSLSKSCSDSRLSGMSRERVDVVSPTLASFPNKAGYEYRFILEW